MSRKKQVILNAAESRDTARGAFVTFVYKALSNLFNTKVANTPIIDVFEPPGREIYNKCQNNPEKYFNELALITPYHQVLEEIALYKEYDKNIKDIADNIKDADNLIIMGHSSKNHSRSLTSGEGKATTTSHIVNILNKAKELRGDKTSDFRISLVACSGINVGRNLITEMRKNEIYGRVTARNHSVMPDPLTGKKLNKPMVSSLQHQNGDYKRILVATKDACLEYKVNEQGKEDNSTLQCNSPEENSKRYFQLKAAIVEISHADDSILPQNIGALFQHYKPSEVYHYLYENPYLFETKKEEKFKELILIDANKKYKDNPTPEHAKHLLEVIKSHILYSTWKTGLGGVTVDNTEYGSQIKVSNTMSKILEVIKTSMESEADSSMNAIKVIRNLVKKSGHSLLRHEETQNFYTIINPVRSTPSVSNNDAFNSIKNAFQSLREKITGTKKIESESEPEANPPTLRS
ncbi:hypothetical protein TUM19329_11530 [Legionella antarctica]|uniref:Peptidase C80 domain-containing protein n=1 Tax=Legionella antarctica TaxID=2708020 RepID=A0A6F8T443_9GAMM|nr:hypothetical protein [Legionella antarctica]BCA94792.1 hypothetical protein TUM19329_11530 [Legionella antarctica]